MRFDVQGPRENPGKKLSDQHSVSVGIFLRNGKTERSKEDANKPSTLGKLFQEPPIVKTKAKEKTSIFKRFFNMFKRG